MSATAVLLWVTIGIAVAFDFTNGFHDTANAIATSISTRALSPQAAVVLSAVFNLVGAVVTVAFFQAKVSNTTEPPPRSRGELSTIPEMHLSPTEIAP